MLNKRQLTTLLAILAATYVGCGKQNASSLQTFWALNQNDDIIVAKGIHQDAITIFKCPTAKNPNLLGDALDLGALDSCADKVMIYESLSYQALKDILLGISPFLIHEMTDATQAELFSQYFNEREGVYERQWLEKKRNELKQSADAMYALIVRKKAIGKKVAPGDEVRLDKTRSELLDAEKALEALDGIEKQIELLVHEFWGLIQEQSIFQTRLTSLYESIVFLGLDETKVPKHNLFNLWFRDISAWSNDLNLRELLAEKNRTKEDGTILNREDKGFGSVFVKSFGDTILLLDFFSPTGRYSYMKTSLLLTAATMDDSGKSFNFVSKDLGDLCQVIRVLDVYSNLIFLTCYETENAENTSFLVVEITMVPTVKFEVYPIHKADHTGSTLSFKKVLDDYAILIPDTKLKEVTVTSLENLKAKNSPIWKGALPEGEKPEFYLPVIQQFSNQNRSLAFPTKDANYFIPWPIPTESKGDGLVRVFKATFESQQDWKNYEVGSFISKSRRTYWHLRSVGNGQADPHIVRFITGISENSEAPGEFKISTSEYTMPLDALNVRWKDTVYWRGHLLSRVFENQSVTKITKPYFY